MRSRILPPFDAGLFEFYTRHIQVPADSFNSPAFVDMATDSEARPYSPECIPQDFATYSPPVFPFIAVVLWRGVGHNDVCIERYLVPKLRCFIGFVAECPHPICGRPGRAKDFEGRARAVWRAEIDCGRLVLEPQY